MTRYGDNKCANCKHNRNCYSQLLGIETYGYGYWECIKDREELEKLKTRNQKAIELINDIFKDDNWYMNYEFNDLQQKLEDIREILQGSDKE